MSNRLWNPIVETYHHKFSFNEDILNANIEMLNKGSRKSHANFRVRVYWGSELVFQECNLWNPFLVWYTMDSASIKRGSLRHQILHRKDQTLHYVCERDALFVCYPEELIPKKNQGSRSTHLTHWLEEGSQNTDVAVYAIGIWIWIWTLMGESWKNVAPPLGFRV